MKRAFVPVVGVPEFLCVRAALVLLRAVSPFCEAIVLSGMAG